MTNIQRSRDFYQKHFGLSVLHEGEDNCFSDCGKTFCSKKFENDIVSLALYIMAYNFCRKHMTFGTTPASKLESPTTCEASKKSSVCSKRTSAERPAGCEKSRDSVSFLAEGRLARQTPGLIGFANEYTTEARREYHTASAELLEVPKKTPSSVEALGKPLRFLHRFDNSRNRGITLKTTARGILVD